MFVFNDGRFVVITAGADPINVDRQHLLEMSNFRIQANLICSTLLRSEAFAYTYKVKVRQCVLYGNSATNVTSLRFPDCLKQHDLAVLTWPDCAQATAERPLLLFALY